MFIMMNTLFLKFAVSCFNILQWPQKDLISLIDHYFINNCIMNQVECLFQSFEGAGSIFISAVPVLTADHVKRSSCRAIILINPHKKGKGDTAFLSNLRQFSLTADREHTNLPPLFHTASHFISEARKITNIMVWCPNDRELGAVFVFAHLILKYGYSIDYIWRLYDKRITYIAISQAFIQKLRYLSKKQSVEDETAKKLKETRLGQRLLRIKDNYAELGKNSHRDWASEKKTQHNSVTNPERSSRRGLSETDFVIQVCDSEPSTRFRERSSTGSEIKTHRSIFKSFNQAY